MAVSLSFSRMVTRLILLLSWRAVSSAILEPPRIITLSISTVLCPRNLLRKAMPSFVATMNTRSW